MVLESTVIAQGLPWPENLTVANAMDRVIREQGAVPAMIAIMDGTSCGSASPEKSSSWWQDRLRLPMSRLREPAPVPTG